MYKLSLNDNGITFKRLREKNINVFVMKRVRI